MAEDKESEAILSGLQQNIKDAFELFDTESNNTVDVREIGTIMCSLGCYPTETQIAEVLAEVEDPVGYVCFERFLPVMTKILMEHKFPPFPEELVLKAFEVLDHEKKGYLEQDELRDYMTQGDEPFTQEEVDEMLNAAVDPDKHIIDYKDFVSKMIADSHT